jgi:hypothetical protein
MAKITTDQQAVDAVATLLGTSAEWDDAADFLDDIANIVGQVRPHPGDAAATYRNDFRKATGREVPIGWDFTDDDTDDDDDD